MPHLRVLLGFANATDHSVEETALSVLDKLWGNPFYTAVPIPSTTLSAALATFQTAIGNAAQGGTAATAAKDAAREVVVAILRQLAGYVQGACGNQLDALLSSGFEAVSTNRTSAPLAKPVFSSLENGMSGQLLPRIKPLKNMKSLEVRYALLDASGTPGPFQSGGLFTSSRTMSINGLTPGKIYMVQVRGIGGSTGYSDWSDPISHMSM
jgi:hypothetical protein